VYSLQVENTLQMRVNNTLEAETGLASELRIPN
jgi:hypothetical protein